MAKLVITRHYTMCSDEVRTALKDIAEHLEKNFELQHTWKGDEVHFKKGGMSGVKGILYVRDSSLHLDMELGLLLRPFESKIRAEMEQFLDKHLH